MWCMHPKIVLLMQDLVKFCHTLQTGSANIQTLETQLQQNYCLVLLSKAETNESRSAEIRDASTFHILYAIDAFNFKSENQEGKRDITRGY